MSALGFLLFAGWFAGLLLAITRWPFVLALWARMPASEHAFALAMGALCLGNLVLAFRSWRLYADARRESRDFAPQVAYALRELKIDEAIRISARYRKSHIARSLKVGLVEFKKGRSLELANRAMDRARAEVIDEYRRTQLILAVSRIAILTTGGVFVLFTTDPGSVSSVENACAAFGLTLHAAAPAFFAQTSSLSESDDIRVELENAQSEVIDYVIKLSGVSRGKDLETP